VELDGTETIVDSKKKINYENKLNVHKKGKFEEKMY
jgi:hypothetical protein